MKKEPPLNYLKMAGSIPIPSELERHVFSMPIKVDPSMPPTEIRIGDIRVTNLFYAEAPFDAAWCADRAAEIARRMEETIMAIDPFAQAASTKTNPNIVLEPKPLYGTHFVGQKPVIDAKPTMIDGKKVFRA